MKKRLLIPPLIAGILVIVTLIVSIAGYYWPRTYVVVSHVTMITGNCPIGETSVTQYKVASNTDITDFTCNTSDLQQATATLEDGSSLMFFLEYDGDYVSWATPEGFTCSSSSWTDNGPAPASGTAKITGRPEQVMITCDDQHGHAMFMKGILPPPPPTFDSQSG